VIRMERRGDRRETEQAEGIPGSDEEPGMLTVVYFFPVETWWLSRTAALRDMAWLLRP
jgi:hypothetical protein